jgi:hypothetical protein
VVINSYNFLLRGMNMIYLFIYLKYSYPERWRDRPDETSTTSSMSMVPNPAEKRSGR